VLEELWHNSYVVIAGTNLKCQMHKIITNMHVLTVLNKLYIMRHYLYSFDIMRAAKDAITGTRLYHWKCGRALYDAHGYYYCDFCGEELLSRNEYTMHKPSRKDIEEYRLEAGLPALSSTTHRYTVKYTVFEERYFDCPKCHKMISDHDTDADYKFIRGNDISEGSILICECGAKIKITGGS